MEEECKSGQEHKLTESSEGIEVQVHEAECEGPEKMLMEDNDDAKNLQAADREMTSSSTEDSQSKKENYQEQTRNQPSFTWSEDLQFSRQEQLTERQSESPTEAPPKPNYTSIEKETVDSQMSLNCHQPPDAKNKGVNFQDGSTFLHSQTDYQWSTVMGQSKTCNDTQEIHKSQSSTKYLDSVITCIQSMSDNQTETERDNVQISRAELALMVEQTLKAQTMCNYMQHLARKNLMLNKQNEVMKETMRIWRNAGDETQTQSCPPETQIFRFDGCSVPPASFPPRLPGLSASCGQDVTEYCFSSQPNQIIGIPSAGDKYPESIVQEDGEPVSDSLQLPSQLSFDGDSLNSGLGVREAAASGTPLLPTTGNSAAAASTAVGTSIGLNFNIPNSDLLYGAPSYSSGFQQHEQDITGSPGVSPEQCALMMDELMKSKMFVRKLCKDGGFHPDTIKELMHYRTEMENLQEENSRLKTDLEHIRRQASARDEIVMKLQAEIKKREDKIPKRPTAECQTDVDRQDRMTQTADQTHQLLQELEKVHSSQMTANKEISSLQYKLQEKNAHCAKLDKELNKQKYQLIEMVEKCKNVESRLTEERELWSTNEKDLFNQVKEDNDQLIKMAERCKYVESRRTEERKRRSRDEKHMVNQVKEDARRISNMAPKTPVDDVASPEGLDDEVEPIITEENHNKIQPPMIIVWRNVVLFLFLHLAALYSVSLLPQAHPFTLLWALVAYVCGGWGITAGAHRLWAHRSYKAKKPLRILLAFFNLMAFQNDILEWSRDHRVHHKYSGTDADPHNAKRGFFFAHIGWLLVRKHPDVKIKGQTIDLSDLYNDPVVRIQRRYYLPLMVLCCFVIPTVVPWYFWGESLWISFFVAAILRYTLTLNATWLVNSAAHMWGNKPYDRNISPTQNLGVSFSAVGEGFHN